MVRLQPGNEKTLAPRKESYDRHRILKRRDTTSLTKAPIVKAMVFPIVMHRRESQAAKKVQCQRIDAFELWC